MNVNRLIPTLALFLPFITGCVNHAPPAAETAGPWTDSPAFLRVDAMGDQIYTWKPDATGKPAWTLKAPDATFTSTTGVTGKHYAGPAWEASDGSKIVARKVAEKPSADPTAVPWLLLEVTKHEGPTGVLTPATWIQRVNTTGGKAPAAPGTTVGEEKRVPYTAQYLFHGPGTTTRPVK
jgi:hypothetical protein